MESARVVVTGLGAVSPLGLTVEELWTGLRSGRCGMGRINAFDPAGLPCQLAGEVPEYRIQNHVPRSHRKAVKLMCRDIELAVIAAQEAVAGSGLVTKGIDPEKINVDPARMAVTLGAAMISCDMVELAPLLAPGLDAGRPAHGHSHLRATVIRRHLLGPLVRRVEGHGPTGSHVRVGLGATPFVDLRQHVLDLLLDTVEVGHLAEHAVAATLGAGAVVAVDQEDQGVVELAGLIYGVDHPTDLVIGHRDVGRKDLYLV